MSAHPIAVLGVNTPYNGGSTASSRASDTPDSATNFAVCLWFMWFTFITLYDIKLADFLMISIVVLCYKRQS